MWGEIQLPGREITNTTAFDCTVSRNQARMDPGFPALTPNPIQGVMDKWGRKAKGAHGTVGQGAALLVGLLYTDLTWWPWIPHGAQMGCGGVTSSRGPGPR